MTSESIQAAYLSACRADINALKPGNVSRYSPGHGMTAEQFIQSAELTAAKLVNSEQGLGKAILAAARKTWDAVGCNTNLGILLLCTPIAHAAIACETSGEIGNVLDQIVTGAGVEDAQAVFDAIALLNPAGLGTSDKHDVRLPAASGLFSIMQYSAGRDRIAWQYANGFDNILSLGFDTFLCAVRESGNVDDETLEKAAVSVFFAFLSRFPDSHIARKHGAYMAEAVRDEARDKKESFNSLQSDEARHRFLMTYDRELKSRGINPGTSADLTVATLFYGLLSQ